MTNKSPFELRAEMLQLAKDYMDKQWKTNVEFTEKMFAEGEKSFEEYKTSMQMYTVDDLMEKAKEMYSFVAKKD